SSTPGSVNVPVTTIGVPSSTAPPFGVNPVTVGATLSTCSLVAAVVLTPELDASVPMITNDPVGCPAGLSRYTWEPVNVSFAGFTVAAAGADSSPQLTSSESVAPGIGSVKL